jgi:hypothetical protein
MAIPSGLYWKKNRAKRRDGQMLDGLTLKLPEKSRGGEKSHESQEESQVREHFPA